jgi:hypothetical protein
MNLVEALLAENRKSRAFIQQLDETAEMMLGKGKTAEDDPGLRASKIITQTLVDVTEDAIASGDVVKMLEAAEAHGIADGIQRVKVKS